jgi:hypothetical protein
MTSMIDVHQSAYTLIRQHGDGAAIQAAMEADAMLDKDNLDGAAVWRQIVAAVNDVPTDKAVALFWRDLAVGG